jgi:adenosylhomocysteinase
MMFAAGREVATRHAQLSPGVYAIPDRVDRQIAERKLRTLGVEIDEPTAAQDAYRDDWQHAESSF